MSHSRSLQGGLGTHDDVFYHRRFLLAEEESWEFLFLRGAGVLLGLA